MTKGVRQGNRMLTLNLQYLITSMCDVNFFREDEVLNVVVATNKDICMTFFLLMHTAFHCPVFTIAYSSELYAAEKPQSRKRVEKPRRRYYNNVLRNLLRNFTLQETPEVPATTKRYTVRPKRRQRNGMVSLRQ